jgi:hypothetical protein
MTRQDEAGSEDAQALGPGFSISIHRRSAWVT